MRGRGDAYLRGGGGAYSQYRPIGGAYSKGRLLKGGGGTNSKNYGKLTFQRNTNVF